MPLSIGVNRVDFPGDTRRTMDADGKIATTTTVRADSTVIPLEAHKLRVIVSPEGHALGKITITTSDGGDNPRFVNALVPIDLTDDDEAPTALFVKDDWPLLDTQFHVEHPRDEPFTLFLITEPR